MYQKYQNKRKEFVRYLKFEISESSIGQNSHPFRHLLKFLFIDLFFCFLFFHKGLGVNVVHIESRPSRRKESEFEILVDVECDNKTMEQLVSLLRREVSAINLKQFEEGFDLPPPTPSSTASFGKNNFYFKCIQSRIIRLH